MTLGGAANIAGLALLYIAYRAGDVSLVAPICSTEGAIAAVIAIAAGEHVQALVIILLVVIVLGVVALPPARTRVRSLVAGRLNWGVVTVTCLGAICFGVSLYATGRASTREQVGWIAASPRLVGVVFVTLPLLASGPVPHGHEPGCRPCSCRRFCEVGGFSLYSLAAHHSLAVAAVLGSLFAAFAVVGAHGSLSASA